MTRGRMVFITADGAYCTYEYNGDMYLERLVTDEPTEDESWGDKAFAALERSESLEQFQKEVQAFTKDYYDDDDDIEQGAFEAHLVNPKVASQDQVNFADDYFEYWFSDYIYVKNGTDHEVKVIQRTGKTDVILPGQTKAYCFGKVVDLENPDNGEDEDED